MTTQEPRLTIELVPSTAWFTNVRSALPKAQWDVLRRQVYAKAGNRCEICGGKGTKWPVECHEVWQYTEQTGIQHLVKMMALCPACHKVKHFGLAQLRGRERQALKHLQKVNGWSSVEATRHVREASLLWERRSSVLWHLDLEVLKDYGVDPLALQLRRGE